MCSYTLREICEKKFPFPYEDSFGVVMGTKIWAKYWRFRDCSQNLQPDLHIWVKAKNHEKFRKNFLQNLDFRPKERCFQYNFWYWTIMNLFIIMIFSKNNPPSGHILKMGAWLQKQVKAQWLMMILWPNGTINNPGSIFIRKLKFSNEF